MIQSFDNETELSDNQSDVDKEDDQSQNEMSQEQGNEVEEDHMGMEIDACQNGGHRRCESEACHSVELDASVQRPEGDPAVHVCHKRQEFHPVMTGAHFV